MKTRQLLLLFSALFVSSSAMAVDANVWEAPTEPVIPMPSEFTSFALEKEMYLYNVGTGLFFTRGNYWGMQASVGTTGLKVKFTTISNPWDGKTCMFYNDTYNQGEYGWKECYFASATTIFVDGYYQTNSMWEITEEGENVYRLLAAEANPGLTYVPNAFVGLDVSENAEQTALSPSLEPDVNHFVDWMFVSPDVYETFTASEAYKQYPAERIAYATALTLYNTAMKLKALIDEAEGIGADVTSETTTYNNTASTLNELKNAITATQKAIEDRKEEIASVDNPADVTNKYIVNPRFEEGSQGWMGTRPAVNDYKIAEYWNSLYDAYQKITGLKAGIYAVGVKGFYGSVSVDESWQNYKEDNEKSKAARFYATVGQTTVDVPIVSPWVAKITKPTGHGSEYSAVDTDEEGNKITYYIPGSYEAAEYYIHTLNLYDNTLLVAVDETGELKIGVKNPYGGSWSIFDDFSLTYYGNGADAWRFYRNGDDTTTDISDMERIEDNREMTNDKSGEVYDLTGRRIKSQASNLKSRINKGLHVVRQSDGRVKKVIR